LIRLCVLLLLLLLLLRMILRIGGSGNHPRRVFAPRHSFL
jgi:hypothetical protein